MKGLKLWLATGIFGSAIAFACGEGTPNPKASASAMPSTPPGVYRSDWDGLPKGASPPEFCDPGRGYRFRWLYGGDWAIAREGDRATFLLRSARADIEEPLSFRRYRGNGFAPDGSLPKRYRIEARGRSLGGARRFGGYGELAIQVYFLDPTHYLEVLQTDRHLCAWLADGAQPGSGDGWTLLARFERPASQGEWVSLSAVVDVEAQTLTVLDDGKVLVEIRTPFLRDLPHYLTLRATGNREEWSQLAIRQEAGDGALDPQRPDDWTSPR